MIANSDIFVIYDDVNYINRGFINKNFIHSGGDKQRITLNLKIKPKQKDQEIQV